MKKEEEKKKKIKVMTKLSDADLDNVVGGLGGLSVCTNCHYYPAGVNGLCMRCAGEGNN